MDLFGGDGEFVNRLRFRLDPRLRSNCTFHIIDASGPSLDLAKDLFVDEEEGRVVVHKPRYIQPNETVFQAVPKPPQFVTAIGGICGGVISRREALGITERLYQEMADGGTFIVTGRTGVLLNAEDFSKIGFKVKQMTVPENVVYLNCPYQLYILEK